MKQGDILTKKLLYKHYIAKQKSGREIAKFFNVSVSYVYRSLKRYEISIRTVSQSNIGNEKLIHKGKNNGNYIDGRASKQNHCKICKQEISINAIRCLSCSAKERLQKHESNCQCIMCRDKSGKNSPRFKTGKYIENLCIDCATKISPQSKRCASCSKLGEKNINFIHGEGSFPYPMKFNDVLKLKIRDRDNHICQNPDCHITEQEHLLTIGTILDVHHIDYNKMNCKEENLISLCRICNIRANQNRDYWYALYTYILELIYV